MAGKSTRLKKERPHNARPYDRPNQSLLGKVASTVKGLFSASTWSFTVPGWLRTEEEGEASCSGNTVEGDLTENEEDEVIPPRSPRLPTRSVKRPRYSFNEGSASTSQSSFWLDRPPLPPTSTTQTVTADVEVVPVTEPSSTIPNCTVGKKDAHIIVNGDDHSENSEGSASTSGCSSLVSSQEKPHRSSGLKLSESALEHLRNDVKKSIFHRTVKDTSLAADSLSASNLNTSQEQSLLWSSRSVAVPLKSPQRPSLGNRPSFNVTSFCGPLRDNTLTNRSIGSPFYEGNTTYGGAAAYRRKQMSTAPYQLNSMKTLRNQLKVKESPVASDLDCMSSAAKRILSTLEKMSTPVTDAKRIPTVHKSPMDIPLTLTPPSHRFKSYLPFTTRRTPTTPKGPPIVNVNAVSKLPLLKTPNSRNRQTSMMEIPISTPHVPLPEECVSKTPEVVIVESGPQRAAGGGKIRTKITQPQHTTKVMEDTPTCNWEYELPRVPLPVADMPSFNLSSTSSPVLQLQPQQKQPELEKPSLHETTEVPFTFANPIYIVPPAVVQATPPAKNTFKFSSPFVVPNPKSSSNLQKNTEKEDTIIKKGSVDDFLKIMREDSKGKSNITLNTNTHGVTDVSKKSNTGVNSFGGKFKPEAGSWECSSCMLRNKPDAQKCNACEASKPAETKSNKIPNDIGFGNKFKPQPGAWECPSCMLRNKPDAQKCAACEAAKQQAADKKDNSSKQTGFGDMFKPSVGSWECSSCMVRNKAEAQKCAACEVPKPTALTPITTSSSIASGFGDKFKPQAGSWECSSCLLRNSENVQKCAACETPNPKQSISSSKTSGDSTVDKNRSVLQKEVVSKTTIAPQNTTGMWKCDICVTYNTQDKNVCKACETVKAAKEIVPNSMSTPFKFGAGVQTSTPFKFAAIASSSVSQVTPPGFTFSALGGSTTSSANATIPTFKFGSATIKLPELVSSATNVSTTSTISSAKLDIPGEKKSEGFKLLAVTTSSGGFQFNTSTSSSEFGGFKFQTSTTTVTTNTGGLSVTSTIVTTATTVVGTSGSQIATAPTKMAESFKFSVPILKSAVVNGSNVTSNQTNLHSTTSIDSERQTVSSSTPNSVSVVATQPISSLETVNSPVTTSTTITNTSMGLFNTSQPTTQQSVGVGAHVKEPMFNPPVSQAAVSLAPVKAATPFVFGSSSLKPTSQSPALNINTQPTVISTTTCTTTTASSSTLFQVSSTVPSAFTFGSSNAATTTSNIFGSTAAMTASSSNIFGSSVTTTTTTTINIFGSGTVTTSTPVFGSTVSSTPSVFGSSNAMAASTSSVFGFGATPTVTSTAPNMAVTTTTPVFGNTSIMTTSKTPPIFGSTMPVVPVVTTAGFSFGSAVSTTSTAATSSTQSTMGVLKFGATSTSSEAAPSSNFCFKPPDKPSFGIPSQPNFSPFKQESEPNKFGSVPTATPFKFGASSNQASAGGFVFGSTQKAESSQPSTTPFVFGGGAAKPSFGFQPAQPTTTTTTPVPGFNFGNTIKTTASSFTPSANPVFSFGAKTNQPLNSSATPAPATGPVFGGNQPFFTPPAAAPAFGSTTTPTFGSVQPAAKSEPTGGFNFNASAAVSPSPVFNFGAPAEKRAAMAPAQASGFNFNVTPQAETNASFPQNFNMSTPPSFNFGATSTSSAPFQFAASSDGSSAQPTPSGQRRIRRAVRRGLRKD